MCICLGCGCIYIVVLWLRLLRRFCFVCGLVLGLIGCYVVWYWWWLGWFVLVLLDWVLVLGRWCVCCWWCCGCCGWSRWNVVVFFFSIWCCGWVCCWVWCSGFCVLLRRFYMLGLLVWCFVVLWWVCLVVGLFVRCGWCFWLWIYGWICFWFWCG